MASQQSKTIYIDPPTIPEGMSVATYRKVRELQRAESRPRGFRRVASPAMVAGSEVSYR